ncbi:formimidoylglutamate deiminase [Vulcanimicrobium alpinum]|uniref:Formimidoylglutamate deiminase n=1 Tax=Vulcanimicrobium alpinum TaxID=3016050 RepID=A0AAN1XUW8_UNVUL|nr:formimidoylglutamate deiminase [Vulcanimicrobium alpinum]BDE05897.1 formimidoylglutamate deiminase [Vulcanimicrobium alpinum]
MRLFAQTALLPSGWAPDVAIEIAPDGTILSAVPGSRVSPDDERIDGPLIPGIANLHSHAFQRAMAGTAERRVRGDDDFWSWRDAMYALAATLDPDALHAAALAVYRAMLAAGYTAVAEFHYLHRDPQGRWYADRAAMARALVEAAKSAGIAICLLPALYAQGDAGGVPLSPRQQRFAATSDAVLGIARDLRSTYARDPAVTIGVCAHSLRAVTPGELRALVDGSPRDVPVHLHVAEQTREVEAVEAALGARPAAWLLEHFDVDARWCFIHATHLDERERDGLARSGAVAGLCPTTEANLGDGLFALAPYLRAGGAFGIGSDSNVSIAPVEELRWLEYGQRLLHRRRIVAATGDGASAGETLYRGAAAGGARACGFAAGTIAPQQRADFVVLDDAQPPLAGAPPHELLDRYVFAADRAAPRAVMSGGRWRAGAPSA